MPTQYDTEAIEKCRELFCRFGGKNHDAIEREMQKVFPGWKKQNLFDRGKGANGRLGWINRYGYENSLKIYTEKLVESVNDDEQDLYLGIKKVRKEMQKKVLGADKSKDDLYQYRDFAKLEIEARRNLDLSRDNLETFVAGYEKLIGWLGDIDKEAAKLLIKNGEKLIELAEAHYGRQAEINDGADARTDESGE